MASNTISYDDKDKIISSGDNEQRMFIIQKGEVQITLDDGVKRIELARLQKGDFFGEISLFNNTPRSADATAVGKTKLLCIESRSELDQYLEKNPGFSRKMVQVLGKRLAKTDELLKKELSGRSQAAVINFLW